MASRLVTFAVHRGRLVRQVRRWGGCPSRRSCTVGVFEDVAWYLQQHWGEGLSATGLWRVLAGAPRMQVQVALDFLLEMGCLVRCGRRCYSRSPSLYEDALSVFHHLAEVGT